MDNLEEITLQAMDHIVERLQEIELAERSEIYSEHVRGMKEALIEIFEILQRWNKAASYGFHWNVEEEFPI